MSLRFHTLRREQWVPRPIEEVFAFFADAGNLERITPPWLGFTILSVHPSPVQAGTEIRYRLSWHRLPMRWITDIRQWRAPHRFVDVQRSGPYSLWHHTHCFESHQGGTTIVDVVRYALPFGALGRVVHALKVQKDVRRIFEYRYQRIEELFC